MKPARSSDFVARSPLPLTARVHSRPTRVRDVHSAAANRLQILLVEDNPSDARMIRELLKEEWSMSFELTHAPKLEDAVRALGEKRFDAVLLDLGLPDAQGLEALVPVNTLAPELPIIVLTGNEDFSSEFVVF